MICLSFIKILSMKHRIFPLILTGLGLMASVSATAKDVYAYTPNGEVLGKATEIKRIEFANGKMSLVPEIGEKTEIALSDLGYFAFKPLESSGVSVIENADVTVSISGNILSVTSASEIKEIRIYNLRGELTGQSAPAASMATMTVNNPGLYIVAVEAGGITQIYKIVR